MYSLHEINELVEEHQALFETNKSFQGVNVKSIYPIVFRYQIPKIHAVIYLFLTYEWRVSSAVVHEFSQEYPGLALLRKHLNQILFEHCWIFSQYGLNFLLWNIFELTWKSPGNIYIFTISEWKFQLILANERSINLICALFHFLFHTLLWLHTAFTLWRMIQFESWYLLLLLYLFILSLLFNFHFKFAFISRRFYNFVHYWVAKFGDRFLVLGRTTFSLSLEYILHGMHYVYLPCQLLSLGCSLLFLDLPTLYDWRHRILV